MLTEFDTSKDLPKPMSKPLYVAKPLLPDLADMQDAMAKIWDTRIVTNGGPLHQQLEGELRAYLGVPTAMLFNNGTIALLVALKFCNLPPNSEVITTPFTFAATAHSIAWNGLKPVFADVLPGTLTLDPESVEKAITPNTSAILPVHVYGSVCEIDAIDSIARKHGLRVIYDAAHAFGVQCNGRPIGSFGDASVFSFHATKLFTTLEGGLITTACKADRESIYYLRNFGIKSEEEVVGIGINGKMNELQAAIGIANLPKVTEEMRLRAILRIKYMDFLHDLPGIMLPPEQPGVTRSEQYFQIVIDPTKFGRTRDDIYAQLKSINIFARKYFHPICTDFEPYEGYPIWSVRTEPYVNIVKSQVLCLPFHSDVSEDDIAAIRSVFRNG